MKPLSLSEKISKTLIIQFNKIEIDRFPLPLSEKISKT